MEESSRLLELAAEIIFSMEADAYTVEQYENAGVILETVIRQHYGERRKP